MHTIPNPRGKFILGHIKSFLKDPLLFLTQNENEYPEISRVKFFNRDVIIVHNPDFVKHVLQSNNKNYVKGKYYKHIESVIGNGILTTEGENWISKRKVSQLAFNHVYID